jgi:hypothetical protein
MSVRRASANSNAVPTHSTFGAGVGIDSSPVAIAIAQAKVVEASVKSVVDCAIQILNDGKAPQNVPQGQFWTCAYSKTVLPQICQLREEFLRDCISSRRKVLQAIVLGALHGPLRKTRPSYFSNHCPRTFAPKPAYAVKYWKRHRMKPPNVDLLAIIRKRAERFLSVTLLRAEGMVLQRDSRKWADASLEGLFSWVITSPPYYGMRTYIPDQWLRYGLSADPALSTIHRGRRTSSIPLQKISVSSSETSG